MSNLKDKKILITGAHAFLGPHVVNNLIKKRGVPKENIFAPRKNELDLRVRESAEKAVVGQDIVFHLASVTGGIEFHRDHPGELFYDNLMMGMHLMEAARKVGVEKFITIGSATEYPATPPVPFKEENLWDAKPDNSNLPYAIAKKMLLVQGQAYAQEYGFNAIHLLLTNMYGPGFGVDSSFVVPSLIRRIDNAKGEHLPTVTVWGGGDTTRDFLFVDDASEGIIEAAEGYGGSDPVNLGSGIEVSIRELAELLRKLIGYQGEINWDTSHLEGQSRRVLDISRAEKEFGFKPIMDFETGLKKTIDYYYSNK